MMAVMIRICSTHYRLKSGSRMIPELERERSGMVETERADVKVAPAVPVALILK